LEGLLEVLGDIFHIISFIDPDPPSLCGRDIHIHVHQQFLLLLPLSLHKAGWLDSLELEFFIVVSCDHFLHLEFLGLFFLIDPPDPVDLFIVASREGLGGLLGSYLVGGLVDLGLEGALLDFFLFLGLQLIPGHLDLGLQLTEDLISLLLQPVLSLHT